MDMQKNPKICEPIRKDATSSTKQFIATLRAKIRRVGTLYSLVKDKKIGLLPRGFTIGNSALTISKMLLESSSTGTSEYGHHAPPSTQLPLVAQALLPVRFLQRRSHAQDRGWPQPVNEGNRQERCRLTSVQRKLPMRRNNNLRSR